MTDRLLPAPKRLALVVRENARGFAALVAFVGALYGLYAITENAMESWMYTAPRVLAIFAPLIVIGSFRQRMAGGAALWLQRPVEPLRFHFARFLEVALVAVASAVLFRGAAVAVGLAAGWEPEAHPLQPLPVDALRAVAMVVAGFGLSCWWGKHGRLATLAYIALFLAADMQVLRADAHEELWAQVVRAVSLPSSASLQEAVWFLAGDPRTGQEPVWLLVGDPGTGGSAMVRFLAYVAAWLGVGAAGILALAERRAK